MQLHALSLFWNSDCVSLRISASLQWRISISWKDLKRGIQDMEEMHGVCVSFMPLKISWGDHFHHSISFISEPMVHWADIRSNTADLTQWISRKFLSSWSVRIYSSNTYLDAYRRCEIHDLATISQEPATDAVLEAFVDLPEQIEVEKWTGADTCWQTRNQYEVTELDIGLSSISKTCEVAFTCSAYILNYHMVYDHWKRVSMWLILSSLLTLLSWIIGW